MVTWDEASFINAMRLSGKTDEEIAAILGVEKIAKSPSEKNKYGNIPVYRDGFFFHSTGEADRWSRLKLLQRAGLIKNLQRQVKFILQENPKITYTADFVYDEPGELQDQHIVEDYKGVITKDYILRKKLMIEKYPEYLFKETNKNDA